MMLLSSRLIEKKCVKKTCGVLYAALLKLTAKDTYASCFEILK